MAYPTESSSFYQDGGTLPSGSPSYVPRQADEDLYNYARAGDFCYVLTARQMGKSSLRIRTTERLKSDGVRCVNIDLTSIGSRNITNDQWYYGLLSKIAQDINIGRKELALWWQERMTNSPLQRFVMYIDEIVLSSPSSVVILIDEIDFLLGLELAEFSSDDFFAAIRSFYNRRAEDPRYFALNFCLFGVAAPNDLMRNPERTPFNIGRSIELGPFSLLESRRFLTGIQDARLAPEIVLERVLYWTGGQPYLTQKLLKVIEGAGAEVHQLEDIDSIVNQYFLSSGKSDANLVNINNRIVLSENYAAAMLDFIGRLLSGELVEANVADPALINLLLSGLIVEKEGRLAYGNHIYEAVFNHEWLERALDRIKRPFADDLKRWLALGKNPAAVLRGEVLDRALEWAQGRTDLSPAEHEYLRACQLVHEEEARRALEAAHALRLKRKNRVLTGLALACALSTLLALFFSSKMNSAERLARETLNRAKSSERLARETLNRAKASERIARETHEMFKKSMGDLSQTPECQDRVITFISKNQGVFPEDLKRNITSLRSRAPLDLLENLDDSPSNEVAGQNIDNDETVEDKLKKAASQEQLSNKAKDYIIPKESLSKYPTLVNMILVSESMNKEERNYWLQVISVMTPGQVAELYDILNAEHLKLQAIDWKYAQRRAGILSNLKKLEELLKKGSQDLTVGALVKSLGEIAKRYSDLDGVDRYVEKVARAASSLFPERSDHLLFLAQIYLRMGKRQPASSAALKAVELDPHHFGAHKLVARLLMADGDPRGALVHYERAQRLVEGVRRSVDIKEIQGPQSMLMIEMAGAYADSAQKGKALELLRNGLALFGDIVLPDDSAEVAREYASRLLQAAQLSEKLGTFEYAVSAARKRVSLLDTCKCAEPVERGRAYGSLGWCQLFVRNFTASIETSKVALELAPGEAWIEGNLAHALLLAGRYNEAKTIYLKHRGESLGNRKWDDITLDDFKLLRNAGITSPDMQRIEKLLKLHKE